MSKIIDIGANKPHKISEVVCLLCLYRWLAVRPEETQLRALECPRCRTQGFAIETGEEVMEENDDR